MAQERMKIDEPGTAVRINLGGKKKTPASNPLLVFCFSICWCVTAVASDAARDGIETKSIDTYPG